MTSGQCSIGPRRAPGSEPAALLGLGTAVPPHQLDQREIADIAREVFAERYPDFERLVAVFYSAGIVKRHMIMPPAWYMEPRHWPDRTKAYLEGAEALFIEAAEKALDMAGVSASEVDAVVTVSSTGIATPSLEARVAGIMGFRTGLSRACRCSGSAVRAVLRGCRLRPSSPKRGRAARS